MLTLLVVCVCEFVFLFFNILWYYFFIQVLFLMPFHGSVMAAAILLLIYGDGEKCQQIDFITYYSID